MKLRTTPLITSLVAITLSHAAHAATGTWNVDADGLWSASGNWTPGIADGSTFTANFTNNITADRIVSLDSARTLNKLVFSDSNTATAGSWLINNNGNAANTLSLGSTTPTITVGSLGSGKSATISAVLASGTDLITKDGTGTLVLSGANTYTNGMLVKGGVVIMNNASASVGGSTSGTYLNGSSLEVNGTSAFRQSAGTVTVAGANDSTNGTGGANGMILGGGSTYGSYELSGGTLQVNNPWRLNPRRAQITQTGGNFNVNYTGTGNIANGRQFIIGSGADRGIYLATAGNLTITTSNTLNGNVPALVIGDTNTSDYTNGAEMTLSGTAEVTLSGGAGSVMLTRSSTKTGFLNLNGGRLTTNSIVNTAVGAFDGTTYQSTGGGVGRLSFDGGTLRAQVDTTTFLQGLTSARIYSGGATIDTNNKNITIGQNLDAPTGGLTSIPLTSGGSGYVGAPIVKITGGDGTGATAVANFDAATGTVTGITITSPGSGYTTAPTVTLVDGRSGGSAATLGTVTVGALTGGGLTKIGNGTLTLSGTNTYSGATVVKAGTLKVNTSTTLSTSSSIIVGDTGSSNAILDATTDGMTVGSSQILAGIGMVFATGKTLTAGGTLSPGDGGIGNLSIDGGSLTLNGNSKFAYTLGTSSDLVSLLNGVALSGNSSLGFADFTFTAGTGFGTGVYTLIDNAGSIATLLDSSPSNLTGFVGGLGATLSTSNLSGNDLILTVVPEPRAALLGGLGLLALLRRRRA